MLSKKFVKDCLERACKTFAQFFVTLWGVGGHYGLSLSATFACSGVAALLSGCTSVLSSFRGDHESASLVK